MYKKLKITFITFTLGILLAFATVAMAASASSSINYLPTILGYSYTNQATVSTDTGNGAQGIAVTQASSYVPTGYIGQSTYLYNYDGYCVTYTPFYYNSSSTKSLSVGTSLWTDHTNYRAKGQSAIYNGSTYNYYDSYYTPWLYY